MVEIPSIELELRKLGLREKEVRVYLAGLELGPSPVQKIAALSKITRPTTYGIIKKLKEKGLFAEEKQKGKRVFIAQSPERILGLLRIQKREIEEKEREFIRIISALEAKYSKEKEGIKIYRGRKGLEALEEILSFSSTPEILVINSKILPINRQKREKIYQKIKKRLGKIVVKEFDAKFEGSLMIFDKIIFFPLKKQKGFLLE
jgi:sugar-specific transcriptional regulator TrmB